MQISEMVKLAGEASKAKGFHDVPTSIGDLLMLIVTEASEAMEEWRKPIERDFPINHNYYLADSGDGTVFTTFDYEAPMKPCGFPSEIADIIIRCGDLCYRHGIDLEEIVKQKMAYNRTRGHLHGGKRI